ncbi:CopG family transcriptional regulator [Sinorhizobium meliloti]|uniref:CopG family ribbon-helix-helix protein n=1 Tax=Rhizobium meliloti TaxID=382 RepID=UPI000FD5A4F1|nr:CopG family transcriptional regulator [Sinorhizobium meliloti]RVI04555.1 CopG family transcriptional regulator [Sinorhizobium meliloti]RVN83172.1 CopG family transcriptional regulator [Sinorhizobium meliloti]RVO04623.1 CopG family transcriptional regulator [Sinorhizobium meliloti]
MAVSPEKKQRLSAYLDPDLKRRLADFADRREQSASLIAEAAIASFLSPDANERKEAAIGKRLDRIDRNLQCLERDLEITNETLALFVRSWLNSVAPLPQAAQATARATGGDRYDKFLQALGRRLAGGPRLHQEISDEIKS